MTQITHIEFDKLNDRNTGRSTRIIDQCIQDLFINGKVFVKDHFPCNRRSDNIKMYDRVLRRLRLEHPNIKIQHNQSKQSITLIQLPSLGVVINEIDTYVNTGRTTRIIDNCIQKLYKYGRIEVYDHHTEKHKETFDKVVKRLWVEHRQDNIIYHLLTNVIELCPKK